MKKQIIKMAMATLLNMLSPELIKRFIDKGLDAIEDYVAGTETRYDDMTVLPVIRMLRLALDIPDND